MKKTDVLLLQVPNHNHEPYHLGLASVDLYLKKSGINSKARDLLFSHGEFRPESLQTDFWENINSSECDDQQRDKNKEFQDFIQFLLEKINEDSPKLIGFSLIAENFHTSIYLIRKIKEKFPEIKTVLGGCGVKWAPLEDKHFEWVNFVVSGAGEEALKSIFFNLGDTEKLVGIPGLSLKKEEGVHWSDQEAPSLPIDQTPLITMNQFNEHPFYQKLFGKEVSIMFHKGCPYRCSFCSAHLYYNKFTKNTVETCVEYVSKFNNQDKLIYIADATINADDEWLKEWAREVIKRDIKIRWRGWFRLSPALNNPEYLKLLVDSGCVSFDFGLETASEEVLSHMKKFANIKVIFEIFQKIRMLSEERGRTVKTKLNILVGYPTETEEDFRKTLKFITFNSDIIQFVSFNAFGMPHNLPLYDRIKADGLLFKNSSNWCSRTSSPDIRISRMNELMELLKKLKIDHQYYLLNDLNLIPQGEKLTLADWDQQFSKVP